MDSPYLNRFIQSGTVIPSPANPQGFNRYSYVMNSPANFNDPTGHMCSDPEDKWSPGCDGSGGYPRNIPHPNPPVPNNGGGNSEDDGDDPAYGDGLIGPPAPIPYGPPAPEGYIPPEVLFHFDSSDFFDKNLPWSYTEARHFAYNMDLMAFAIDLGVEAASILAIIGGGTLGGPAGAFDAWVATQVTFFPAMAFANGLASLATVSGVSADLITGETGFSIGLYATESQLTFGYQGVTSTNTKASTSITQLGLVAPISELSLPLQGLAVANDIGLGPSFFQSLYPKSQSSFSITIPLTP